MRQFRNYCNTVQNVNCSRNVIVNIDYTMIICCLLFIYSHIRFAQAYCWKSFGFSESRILHSMTKKFNFAAQRPIRGTVRPSPSRKMNVSLRGGEALQLSRGPYPEAKRRQSASRFPAGPTRSIGKSVLDMLRAGHLQERSPHDKTPHARYPAGTSPNILPGVIGDKNVAPTDYIGEPSMYMNKLKCEISEGRRNIVGNPWVRPVDPFVEASRINAGRARRSESNIDAKEALHLILRPSMFFWAPHALFPDVVLRCPYCKKPVQCNEKVRWGRTRTLHTLNDQHAYASAEYSCPACPGLDSNGGFDGIVRRRLFWSASKPQAMTMLPKQLMAHHDLLDTKRRLCDRGLVDMVRALATRTSWGSIAETITEMKMSTWVLKTQQRYLMLCEHLGIFPIQTLIAPKSVFFQDSWVRDFFILDFNNRRSEIIQELGNACGGDVIRVDWTKSIASSCGSGYMFNVMGDDRMILASSTTRSGKPNEVEHVMLALKARGINPKVVYVDDECCGLWNKMLAAIWPTAVVRLDPLHAIWRLTRTTRSAQHPWHGAFCKAISNAIFAYDEKEVFRLMAARAKDGLARTLPRGAKSKYIPRVICDQKSILDSIDIIVEEFQKITHNQKGPLLTPATDDAWRNLRLHVAKGCLADPENVNMNVYNEKACVIIGGEQFKIIKTSRGSSALEGFHNHQKRWLGIGCRHSIESGLALITDGTLRWNRKRHNDATDSTNKIPLVFAGGTLRETNDLSRTLTGEYCFPGYKLCVDGMSSMVTCGVGSLVSGERQRPATCDDLPPAIGRLTERLGRCNIKHSVTIGAPHISTSTSSRLLLPFATTGEAELNMFSQLPVAPLSPDCQQKCVPTLALTPRAGCRRCRFVGAGCKQHQGIQWCAGEDKPFDRWAVEVFPLKKSIAREHAAQKVARMGGKVGRPKKHH